MDHIDLNDPKSADVALIGARVRLWEVYARPRTARRAQTARILLRDGDAVMSAIVTAATRVGPNAADPAMLDVAIKLDATVVPDLATPVTPAALDKAQRFLTAVLTHATVAPPMVGLAG